MITGQLNDINDLEIEVTEGKIKYIVEKKNALERIGIKEEELIELLKKKIGESTIFNISFEHLEEHNVVNFCIFYDKYVGEKMHKFTIALKYDYKKKILSLNSLY